MTQEESVTAQTSRLKGAASVIMLFNHWDICLLFFFFKGKQLYQKNFKQDKKGTADEELSSHTNPHSAALCRGNMCDQLL